MQQVRGRGGGLWLFLFGSDDDDTSIDGKCLLVHAGFNLNFSLGLNGPARLFHAFWPEKRFQR